MTTTEQYIQEVQRLIALVKDTQSGAIEAAAALCADALCGEGFLFTFGTGHSHMLAEEIFYRAGGLARVCPILEDSLMLHRGAAASSMYERAPGLATLLLNNVDALRYGGVLFIFSNSGCNTVAVEMAELARERGLKTVCITNVTHSARMISRHPKGLKLKDACDVVIDNCGCYGDAAIPFGEHACGATSTVIGSMIMQAIVCRTVELCRERGVNPELFSSANTLGGDEKNAAHLAKYKPIVKSL